MTVGAQKPNRFFIPNSTKAEAEAVYSGMRHALFDQLKLTISDRRIQKLSHQSGKRTWHFAVGQPKPQESQYIVMAIFEAGVFVVMNQTPDGAAGPIVLIDKDEVTAIEDFQA